MLKDHSTELRDELLSKRPATPLPWTEEVAILPEHQQDVTYIVHAANSYPRLVEVLADVMRDQLKTVNLHQMAPGPRQRIEKARALLRSLGESE